MNEQRNELINNENNNSQKLAHGYLLKEWTNLHECLNRVQEEEKSQRKKLSRGRRKNRGWQHLEKIFRKQIVASILGDRR